MFKFSVIGSGSRGNAVFVRSDKTTLMVDCGLSLKRIISHISAEYAKEPKFNGLLVTHEHTDHIGNASRFAKKFTSPVYIHEKTAQKYCGDESLLNYFSIGETMSFNDLTATSIKTSHDAAKPCGFVITHKMDNTSLGIFTDTGLITAEMKNEIPYMDSIIMESNHDTDMLVHGNYPKYLKARICSDVGHLSNYTAANTLLDLGKEKINNIVLAHLSEENNTPKKAMDTINIILKERKEMNPKISIALQAEGLPFFDV